MQATLNNWRGSPRKFNEYLRAVRGLRAMEAADRLMFMTSPYAQALRKLILSAVANASQDTSIQPTSLLISEATTGRAMFYKRVTFRGRGRTGRITKFGSNVTVVLKAGENKEVGKTQKSAKNASAEAKPAKAAAAKKPVASKTESDKKGAK